MEVADIFVVNKADHPEVHRTIKDLRYLQSLLPQAHKWEPPIHSTIAIQGEGIPELADHLTAHYEALEATENGLESRKEARNHHVLLTILRAQLGDLTEAAMKEKGQSLLDGLNDRSLDPYEAAETLLKDILNR